MEALQLETVQMEALKMEALETVHDALQRFVAIQFFVL